MEVEPKETQLYTTANGKVPFVNWLDSLKDIKAKTKVDQAIEKIQLGLLTNCRPVGSGVSEFKIDFGPGYRIYFGQSGSIIWLLLGGNKSTQDQDIAKAQEYWADHEKREGTNQ